MKIEIDNNALVDAIVSKVVQELKPVLMEGRSKGKDNELMTVEQVAKYLNVTKSFVYERVHCRTIPFSKAGKFSRFSKKHIDLWLLNPYHSELSVYNLNHK